MRKVTKFQTCERHRWLEAESRYRRVIPPSKAANEGGKADSQGKIAVISPGAGRSESEFPLDWTKPEDALEAATGGTRR